MDFFFQDKIQEGFQDLRRIFALMLDVHGVDLMVQRVIDQGVKNFDVQLLEVRVLEAEDQNIQIIAFELIPINLFQPISQHT